MKAIVLGLLALAPAVAHAGTLVRLLYDGIPGTAVTNLTTSPFYPDFPSVAEVLDRFAGSMDVGDDFGSVIEGYVVAPETGDYRFFIRSGDASELWVSGNHLASGLVRVAQEVACCNPFMDDAERASGPIPLVRGNKYLIRAMQKAGSGGDFIEVGWTLPGQTGVPGGPIAGLHLAPKVASGTAPEVTLPPADITVGEGETAIFFVNANADQPAAYQWSRNGSDVDGSILQYHRIENARLADSGTQWRVRIQSASGSLTTAPAAILTVVRDLVPPTVVSAETRGNPAGFDLQFSEKVLESQAEDTANYAISGGATLVSATLRPDGRTVRFVTSNLNTAADPKVVTVNNVADQADARNGIAPNSRVTLLQADGTVAYNVYTEIGGTAISDLTGHAKFPNSPDFTEYRTRFEGRTDWADDYGAQLAGYVTAPKSGDYIFAISAGGAAQLHLSTDESPANKHLIATEPEWNGARAFTTTERRSNRQNVSGSITLVEGSRYYIEALVKEGSGGDNLSAAWQVPGGPAIVDGEASLIPGSYLTPYLPTYTAGPIRFKKHPTDQTVTAPNPVTFTAEVDGTPAYQFQWLRNGAPISGANGVSYTIHVTTVDDDGAKFSVRVGNAFSQNTTTAGTLTVFRDTVTPQVVSAGSLDGRSGGVVFNEVVGAATANVAGHYRVSGATVTGARLRADNKSVELTLSGTTGPNFALTVTGVEDLGRNPVATGSEVLGVVANMTSTGIGGLTRAGTQFSGNLGDIDLVGGGAGVGGTADQCHFTYAPRTGNFDVNVRVNRLDDISIRTQGGLMARETTNGNSRSVVTHVSRVQGSDAVETGVRQATGGDMLDAQTLARLGGDVPNTWIRLRRVGQEFTAFNGTDGVSWSQHGRAVAATDLPATLLLGVFVASNADGTVAATELRGYGDTTYPGAGVAITVHPLGRQVGVNSRVRLSCVATVSSAPPNELVYQWMRNGVEILGANASDYVTPSLVLADSGVKYSCKAYVPGAITVSQEATVTVVFDRDAPMIAGARGSATFDRVYITFDGHMDPVTTAVAANYAIGGLTVSGAAMDAERSTVILNTSKQSADTLYSVTVNNVTDLSGNRIAVNTALAFRSFSFVTGTVVMRRYDGIGGTSVDRHLRAARAFPNVPTLLATRTLIESPTDAADNYGAILHGYITPSVTGAHHFWISADANAQFWLSSDESPANMALLCVEPEGNGSRQFQVTDRRGGLENRSRNLFPSGLSLEVGKKYYFEALMKAGRGGDNLSVAWQIPGGVEPANGAAPIGGANIGIWIDPMASSITFVQHPQNQTTVENGSATFSGSATGSSDGGGVVTYQWQRNNGVDEDWTAIPGATGTSYTIAPVTMADNGTRHRLVATVLGLTAPSDPARLTVSGDVGKPRLISVGSLDGIKVGLRFDEGITAASAQDPSSYRVTTTGGTVTVISAVLRADGRSVELTVSGLTGNDFSVSVSGIQDRAAVPNTIEPSTTVAGRMARGITSFDIHGLIGNPASPTLSYPSAAFPYAEGSYEVLAGGAGIGDVNDGCHFLHEQRTGDFDVRVKVTRLDATNPWAKAGLMVRESLAAGSRNLNIECHPLPVPARDGSGDGANSVEGTYRPGTDQVCTEWPGGARSANPAYPNQWLRLQRQGQTFRGYRSTDGEDWQLFAKAVMRAGSEYPVTTYVGMATTSHNNRSAELRTVADYQHYADFAPAAGAKQILIATGGTELPASDQALVVRLAGGGYQVTTGRDALVGSDDMGGKDLLIISASVASGSMVLSGVHKFHDSSLPVVCMENANYDDLFLTGTVRGTDFGTQGNQTVLTITDGAHPLAAGLTGSVIVASDLRTFAWGVPNGNAAVVAKGSNGKPSIFAYGKGALLVNGSAAAGKRIGYYADTALDRNSTAGDTLLSGLIAFALTPDSGAAAPSIRITRQPNGEISLTWTGVATLQASDSIAGGWVDLVVNVSGHTVTPAAVMQFYRLTR